MTATEELACRRAAPGCSTSAVLPGDVTKLPTLGWERFPTQTDPTPWKEHVCPLLSTATSEVGFALFRVV